MPESPRDGDRAFGCRTALILLRMQADARSPEPGRIKPVSLLDLGPSSPSEGHPPPLVSRRGRCRRRRRDRTRRWRARHAGLLVLAAVFVVVAAAEGVVVDVGADA